LEFATLVLHHWGSWTISLKFGFWVEACSADGPRLVVDQGSVGLISYMDAFRGKSWGQFIGKLGSKKMRAVSCAGGDASRVPWQQYKNWSVESSFEWLYFHTRNHRDSVTPDRVREPGFRNSFDTVLMAVPLGESYTGWWFGTFFIFP